MKKLVLLLTGVFALALSSRAQLSEGHFQFTINMSSDNPEMEMAMSMMQGSTLDVFFSGDKTRSEMQMGTMMKMVTITDVKSDVMLMLLSGMIGNKAIKSTITELNKEAEAEKANYTVELVNETKNIEGYDCKKALLKDEEGHEMIFWYTEEIVVNKSGQNYLNDQVPGFPLAFELLQGDMLMSMTVTKLEKKIDKKADLFNTSIPSGYQEMTLEQMKQMGM